MRSDLPGISMSGLKQTFRMFRTRHNISRDFNVPFRVEIRQNRLNSSLTTADSSQNRLNSSLSGGNSSLSRFLSGFDTIDRLLSFRILLASHFIVLCDNHIRKRQMSPCSFGTIVVLHKFEQRDSSPFRNEFSALPDE